MLGGAVDARSQSRTRSVCMLLTAARRSRELSNARATAFDAIEPPDLAGRRVPELEGPTLIGRNNGPTVRRETGHGGDRAGAQSQELGMAKSLEVAPFPAAERGWAAGKQLLGPADVAAEPFLVRSAMVVL